MVNKRIMQEKQGKQWIDTFTSDNAIDVYKWLCSDLIAKKLNQCTYIKSIKRTPLYDGTQQIIINYSSTRRAVFIIDQH